MGISMPKFIADGCASVKETYHGFKNGCEGIKETFKMAKTAYKIARSLDTSKFAETKDPKDIIDAIHTSGTDIPETYKSLLKFIPEDTLTKVTNILFESISKSKAYRSSGNTEASKGPTHEYQRRPSDHTESTRPDLPTQESVSEAIGRMTDAITKKLKHPESDSEPPPSQQDYIDLDPPAQSNYNNGYSEMKSDDEGESRFSNHNVGNEEEEKERTREPFGMRNDNFNFRQTSDQEEQPSSDSADTSSFASQENSYYRQQDRDQSDNFAFQNQSAGPKPKAENELPPLTKKLGEELLKRYGPNWRKRMPAFIHNPETTENLPDLGLGLSKESNRDMVVTMSRVLKDLV